MSDPLPMAVVANADNIVALSVFRSLGRAGIPVHALFGRGAGTRPYQRIVRASRYLVDSQTFDEGDYDANLVAALERVAATLPRPGILFPVSDRDMLSVSKHRARLQKSYRLLLPAHDMLDALLGKEQFCRLADEHAIPIPRTRVLESESNRELSTDGLRYPCIVKPSWRDPAWIARFGHTKVLQADSADALRRCVKAAQAGCASLVIQECIPGPETEIACTFSYLDESSRPLALSTCRKVRQYPVGFGNTAMAESTENHEVAELHREICSDLRLVGYVSIEFKRDPDDGKHKVLEITPARVNRQAGISDHSGANIPLTWYNHLAGRPAEPETSPSPGIRWVSEMNDWRALPGYLRRKNWSLGAWLKSYRGVACWEILAKDDPAPALAVPFAALGHMFRRRDQSRE